MHNLTDDMWIIACWKLTVALAVRVFEKLYLRVYLVHKCFPIVVKMYNNLMLFVIIFRNGCPLLKGASSTLRPQKEDVLNWGDLWTPGKG